MSNTPPIERLNYFNGQRLEAADFNVEQGYHIRVRRLLTQALFTPGIAAGLTVAEVLPEPSHTVRVHPGVAIDSLGREIILVKWRDVPVAGKPTKLADPVIGNYLIIRYAEETTGFAGDGCAVQLGVTCKATEDLAWGDLSRIRAEPEISIQDQWPKPEDNTIVLAQLALNPLDCSVREIRTFVRKYVAAAKEAKSRALGLEGEKDIDKDNPKQLYFRITNGAPESGALYLRAANFSTLYYTEIGKHTHPLTIKLKDAPAVSGHAHGLGGLETDFFEAHQHTITANTDGDDPADDAIYVDNSSYHLNLHEQVNMKVSLEGGHSHKILPGGKTELAGDISTHTHVIETATAGEFGAKLTKAHSDDALSYVNDLQIALDGANITTKVLQQLRDRDEPNVANGLIWKTLGDGTDGHKLAAKDAMGKVEGTGEIDLLRLGVDLAPGEHRLTFSVPDGGGQIQYNLYIE